jgi:hypothetical protein
MATQTGRWFFQILIAVALSFCRLVFRWQNSRTIGQIAIDVENEAASKALLLLNPQLNACYRDHRRNFHR